MATATDYLSTYLGPIAEGLTPQLAERILSIRPSEDLLQRVRELGEKSSGGVLSPQENAEYSYYVDVDDVIGLLKAKARSLLNRLPE
jgi:hypothetical protein